MRRGGWKADALVVSARLAALLRVCTGLGCVEEVRLPPTQIRYCSALCTRLVECSPNYSRAVCISACNSDPLEARINEQVYALQVECISAQTCEAVLDQENTECLDRAIEELAPSDTCIDYCLDDTTASYECGGGYSVEDCIRDGVCSWHDEVLAGAMACNASNDDCEARVECLDRVFGGP